MQIERAKRARREAGLPSEDEEDEEAHELQRDENEVGGWAGGGQGGPWVVIRVGLVSYVGLRWSRLQAAYELQRDEDKVGGRLGEVAHGLGFGWALCVTSGCVLRPQAAHELQWDKDGVGGDRRCVGRTGLQRHAIGATRRLVYKKAVLEQESRLLEYVCVCCVASLVRGTGGRWALRRSGMALSGPYSCNSLSCCTVVSRSFKAT